MGWLAGLGGKRHIPARVDNREGSHTTAWATTTYLVTMGANLVNYRQGRSITRTPVHPENNEVILSIFLCFVFATEWRYTQRSQT